LKLNVGVASLVGLAGPVTRSISGGTVSTVKLRLATAPWLPTASLARSSNLWGPSNRKSGKGPGWCEWVPEHGPNSASSNLHSNHAVSFAVNVKMGRLSVVGPVGPPVIVATAPVVSTVNVWLAGAGSGTFVGSTART
jgi:hypothetical protein